MASSFQRKIKIKLPDIPGLSPSIYTSLPLTSTGNEDLDLLLGGGLPIGTILVIEEDLSGNFAKLMLKYFLSEGLVYDHSLFIMNSEQKSIVHSLPSFDMKISKSEPECKESDTDKMKIAWRYQNQRNTKENSNNVERNHVFNLLKTVTNETIAKSDITNIDASNFDWGLDNSGWKKTPYCHLVQKVNEKIINGRFNIDPSNPVKNLLRIGIHSLGNLLWGDLDSVSKNLCTFLLSLRAQMRSCFGVAVITIPAFVINHPGMREKILLCSDFVVELESFEGDEVVNPVYKDYHGLLYIHKIPSVGLLAPPNSLIQDPSQLVFKSKRTKFIIEKFHLPPDFSENVSRDQKDQNLKSKNLEF